MATYIPEIDCVFLHIPKTAGTFIDTFLHKNFNAKKIDVILHDIPLYLEPEYQKKKMFSFVRKPEQWYPSYWSCAIGNITKEPKQDWVEFISHNNWGTSQPNKFGWHPQRLIDYHCGSRDFNEFVLNCINAFPGYVSYMYKLYTDHCFFVGKFENLYDDLKALFAQFDIDISKQLAEMPKINEADPKWKELAVYKPEVLELVKLTEICEFYPQEHLVIK
jgi:hypothetical protein